MTIMMIGTKNSHHTYFVRGNTKSAENNYYSRLKNTKLVYNDRMVQYFEHAIYNTNVKKSYS